jgi:hypothetical protein
MTDKTPVAIERNTGQGQMDLAQLQIRVAELLGWKVYDSRSVGFVLESPTGNKWAQFSTAEIAWGASCIPDYPFDLNACHEAERTLTEEQKWTQIKLIVSWEPSSLPILSRSEALTLATATAEQRCRAFVKTMEASSVPKRNETL